MILTFFCLCPIAWLINLHSSLPKVLIYFVTWQLQSIPVFRPKCKTRKHQFGWTTLQGRCACPAQQSRNFYGLNVNMSSLIAREESLLKQLVRSRATKRDDLLLPGFGLPVRNARSFSQPPPRMKAAVLQPGGGVTPPPGSKSPGSPNIHPVQYTLQWLPYTLVCQPSQHSGLNTISLSQPDLSRCGTR